MILKFKDETECFKFFIEGKVSLILEGTLYVQEVFYRWLLYNCAALWHNGEIWVMSTTELL